MQARKSARRDGARKLTPQVQRRLCQAVRAGANLDTAAVIAGISERTLHYWRARGREQRSGVYAEFLAAFDRAVAEFEVEAIGLISKAAQDPRHWCAAAWLLERRIPQRWARPEIQVAHFAVTEDQGPRVIRMPLAGLEAVEPNRKERDGG